MSLFAFSSPSTIRHFAHVKSRSLALLLLLVCVLVGYRHLENDYSLRAEDGPFDGTWNQRGSISQENFTTIAIDSAVKDDYDPSHVRAVCDAQSWDSSLVFDCRGIIGGIGDSCTLRCESQD